MSYHSEGVLPGIRLGGDVTVASMWPQFDPRHFWAGSSVLRDLPLTSELRWQFGPQPRCVLLLFSISGASLLLSPPLFPLFYSLPLLFSSSLLVSPVFFFCLLLVSLWIHHSVNWVHDRLVSCCLKIEVSLTSDGRETGFQSEVAECWWTREDDASLIGWEKTPVWQINCGGPQSYNRSTVVQDK